MAIPGHETYLDFAKIVLGNDLAGCPPRPFNAIFFDLNTLENVYAPDCCTAAGIEAFAELLVRHLFNSDTKTIITQGISGEIVRKVVKIVQENEICPGAWEKICSEIHNLEDDEFDWSAYRDAVEKRLEHLFKADGFIPVFIEGKDSAVYFIPFQFFEDSVVGESGGVRIFSQDGESFENSSWEDELKYLPIEITEGIRLGIHSEKEIAWTFSGSSLLLPIVIAWWRKKGELRRYNHFRVMATGRFDKFKKLRKVDISEKERAFSRGIKGGRLIRPGNGGSECEITIGAHVDEVLDRVRNLTYCTADSMFKALKERWSDPVTSYHSTSCIGCRVIERILALRRNDWCAVIESPVFKVEGRMSDVGLSLLKIILVFSNSASGGCILIKMPKGVIRENTLHAVEEVLQDAKSGFADANGHNWLCRRDFRAESPKIKEDIEYHSVYSSPMDEVLVLTVLPSRQPYVLHRKCDVVCSNGRTIPLTCMSVCKRTKADSPNDEWTIPDILRDWGTDGVLKQIDVLGEVLDEDERMFDRNLFASVERIRRQGWSLARRNLAEFPAMSCQMARTRILGQRKEQKLILLESDDASIETRRRMAMGILLNDLRLHEWGTPVPVIVRVDRDDVDNWDDPNKFSEDLLIQLLERGYPAGEFPVYAWRQLIRRRLLTLVVLGDDVEVAVESKSNRPIQRMVRRLLRIVGNDVVWVGEVPNEVRRGSMQLDTCTLKRIYEGETA